MGLMDMAGALFGGQPQGGGLLNIVMGLVNEHGGVQGLVSRMQAGGLGDQAKSWVGTGENLPISAGQLQDFLGSEKLQALASQFGMDHQDMASGLAEMLPKAVDHLTPGGEVPAQGQDLLGLLKGFLG